jgi:hypothetical protein
MCPSNALLKKNHSTISVTKYMEVHLWGDTTKSGNTRKQVTGNRTRKADDDDDDDDECLCVTT